jgi:hypothetical protein
VIVIFPINRIDSTQVDNEHLNRKKSKCCCVYVKPKKFGESDSESESDKVNVKFPETNAWLPNFYTRLPTWKQGDRGPFFCTFFQGKCRGKFRQNFSPKMCRGKLEFSAEKVSKNRFPEKFRGKSLSAEKNVRIMGPRWVCEKNRPKFSLNLFSSKLIEIVFRG